MVYLTKEEIDIMAQEKEKGKLSLRRILAAAQTAPHKIVRLEHFDKDLEPIAYVRMVAD